MVAADSAVDEPEVLGVARHQRFCLPLELLRSLGGNGQGRISHVGLLCLRHEGSLSRRGTRVICASHREHHLLVPRPRLFQQRGGICVDGSNRNRIRQTPRAQCRVRRRSAAGLVRGPVGGRWLALLERRRVDKSGAGIRGAVHGFSTDFGAARNKRVGSAVALCDADSDSAFARANAGRLCSALGERWRRRNVYRL